MVRRVKFTAQPSGVCLCVCAHACNVCKTRDGEKGEREKEGERDKMMARDREGERETRKMKKKWGGKGRGRKTETQRSLIKAATLLSCLSTP